MPGGPTDFLSEQCHAGRRRMQLPTIDASLEERLEHHSKRIHWLSVCTAPWSEQQVLRDPALDVCMDPPAD